MDGELRRASAALDERKAAALGACAPDESAHLTSTSVVMAMLSGFDLDPTEVAAFERFIAGHGVAMITRDGIPTPHTIASCYVDGLAMGLLIAEARQRREARP